nr:hypothetical protein GCM10020093_065810 [Planobispora longispora]
MLTVAGNETTRNLISHAVLALIERPDVYRELAGSLEDEELWRSATEEFLRWGSSIHNFRRTALRDTELHGQKITEGEKVVTFYASANYDEEIFTDPLTLDIRRTPNDHVTFGGGGPTSASARAWHAPRSPRCSANCSAASPPPSSPPRPGACARTSSTASSTCRSASISDPEPARTPTRRTRARARPGRPGRLSRRRPP